MLTYDTVDSVGLMTWPVPKPIEKLF